MTFLSGLYELLSYVLQAYNIAIVIYAIMSWVPRARFSRFGQIIARIVEPLFSVIDRIIPSFGGISFSPLIALGLVYLLQRLLSLIFFGVF
ncbi:YggT family protein [Lapidilactobacillus mulanensis]|uniref:YggT family protein n=1 Tax=Lapidilactobacillus mulanensis TaxID=2485999 RepID=A0ABW4DMK8_9LACO|nr:YggT family protein [Lapidilactobacillus mulanensis]